jgi:hypothetical protein
MYAAHAGRLLVNDRNAAAVSAYLTALRQDPRKLSRYYYLVRAIVPNRFVRLVKSMLMST